jgi:hypothetical protein
VWVVGYGLCHCGNSHCEAGSRAADIADDVWIVPVPLLPRKMEAGHHALDVSVDSAVAPGAQARRRVPQGQRRAEGVGPAEPGGTGIPAS